MFTEFVNFISENLLIFQLISFFISAIFLGFSIYFIIKINLAGERLNYYREVIGGVNISKRRTLKIWKRIQQRLKTGKTEQLKLAILEADKILDEILKMAGYRGKNLEERLSFITVTQLSNIEEIKQAHKLKKRIVSEPDFTITLNEARAIIDIYEKAFQELNLIE